MSFTPFSATVLGSPRIGPKRELKKAVESYWAKKSSAEDLAAVAKQLRTDTLTKLKDAGFDSVPVNTFSYYDQVLDAAVLLGALPERVKGISNELDRYFAAARGNQEVAPLEMTKWFDTNYHYIVPEISPATKFALDPSKIFAELDEAKELGVPARPVVIGPVTFLLLSKPVDGQGPLLDRIGELIPLYKDLLAQLKAKGVEWVQLDEPVLVTDKGQAAIDVAVAAYQQLTSAADRPSILLATYFSGLGLALEKILASGIDGIAVDLVYGSADHLAGVNFGGKLLAAGVVDGRNIWRTDLDKALTVLEGLKAKGVQVAVSSSSSLLHVPYSLAPETHLDDTLRSWLAFGDEKITEVATLAKGLKEGRGSIAAELDSSAKAQATRRTDPRLNDKALRDEIAKLRETAGQRGPADQRISQQNAALGIPKLPTTTIGSFPQTREIRVARQKFTKGEITAAEYEQNMRDEVASVIKLQEELGLDVLVHGEPERNDMVQYFAEQLEGFFATSNGWVQSYGSRCVRPPVLYGDVKRPNPMTVAWSKYAQSLTEKPVKGMLTGPVTILAWSFVRDDQPLGDTAYQVALAIREETVDLQNAGIKVIQVDEPALRETLPLKKADQASYLDWAVGSFKFSTSGVEDSTQIHTHLCYSEFGEVIGAIADLDADVTSIEAARSHMEVLDDLNAAGFKNGVGPGVYDIHSPRVPSVEEIVTSLKEALAAVPVDRLWVNPDCGLKTRGETETKASLVNLVEATKQVRATL
ncbi:5-methyltetrahydropteroyltriglutamate--homocysteine S-methyltransferase [Segniliparus rugosus]|uniref:5-methyltetrahydropteroyltriglutamate--homocysteine methyltransferase n=1 Tax=Segniliparus rugosus (strain ATCC BAA-974 / DSM 45345 / CCUG 50838 / CIP 108380 / JCM 13579 / CDC 945) TaxID=679197 RepID=E5XUP6_SEGRC|nr:5-methyltetrahydropteroyltriglutamate--homocysteine S-methyltransferase [Segniliparus rugosus]EFV11884.1 5-methyltetrahydropteroyltriglutamate-homocysteine S-methyltransferase [Segniliparus rugosus ATCC BAA-974]